MKKNILALLALALLMPLANSCNDWLEEHPYAIATDTFYNTVDEANAAVASVSRQMYQVINGGIEYLSLMECFSDYDFGRGTWASNSYYQVLDATNYGRTDGLWGSWYRIIRDANIVIQRIPEASSLTDAQKTSYIAEARFYRGYAYMIIARYYGKGPLRTEENMTEWDLPMSTESALWDFFMADLTFAAQNCPDKPVTLDRPSKSAAKAALAEAYMWKKDFSSAKTQLESIINSGSYSLVPVETSRDFDNIFGYSVTNTPEEVYYIKTSETSSLGIQVIYMYNHPQAYVDGQRMLVGSAWYGLVLSSKNKWVSEWDVNDLRKDFNVLPFKELGTLDNFPLDCLTAKFHDPVHNGFATCDYPMYRYADILMMEAECLNETNNGPTEQAMEYLNMIHRRAYGHDPKTPSEDDLSLADYNTKEKFMEILTKENCYEFWGEGKRWNFLLRTGQEKKYIKEYKGRDIDPNFYHWRIPQSEFDYNKALNPSDQNPGY